MSFGEIPSAVCFQVSLKRICFFFVVKSKGIFNWLGWRPSGSAGERCLGYGILWLGQMPFSQIIAPKWNWIHFAAGTSGILLLLYVFLLADLADSVLKCKWHRMFFSKLSGWSDWICRWTLEEANNSPPAFDGRNSFWKCENKAGNSAKFGRTFGMKQYIC